MGGQGAFSDFLGSDAHGDSVANGLRHFNMKMF
jgi:hypothetical protein